MKLCFPVLFSHEKPLCSPDGLGFFLFQAVLDNTDKLFGFGLYFKDTSRYMNEIPAAVCNIRNCGQSTIIMTGYITSIS
jgi:hypothetical protein